MEDVYALVERTYLYGSRAKSSTVKDKKRGAYYNTPHSMEKKMTFDKNKLYHVHLNSVKYCLRPKFGKMGLQFSFNSPDLNLDILRTVDVPKTFLANKGKFFEVFGPILEKSYHDSLLENPEHLASNLEKDLSQNSYLARLSIGGTGHLNIEQLKRWGDG